MEHLAKNKVKDFLVTGEEFSLVLDSEIPEMLRTMPRPFPHELHKYYESSAYISHTDAERNFTEKIYQKVKKYNLAYKKKLLSRFSPTSVLDYGCGTGSFVAYLHTSGISAYGYEPHDNAINIAKQKLRNSLLTREEAFSKKYDIITLWHVLEHIPNYDLILSELKKCLTPGGRIIIAVPNYHSYDAKFYKNYWAAYDVPRHLWHFTSKSIQSIAKKFGTIIEYTMPMYFDAFYVSLLSEKYKGTNKVLAFLRAMLIGGVSNTKAIFSGQYSSIIYVLKL